jgi:hypothetical protein
VLSGLGRQYYDLRFADRNARLITFKDPSVAGTDSKLRTWAFVKVARSGWRAEDWTGRDKVEYCRDDKTEDVREVVLIHSTTKRAPRGDPGTVVTRSTAPKLRLRDRCGAKVVLHISGTESLTITDPFCGLKYRSSSPGWHADIEFDIRSRFGTRPDQSEMVGGSGSGNLTGESNICDGPEPFNHQEELGAQGIATGSLEVKPTAGGARVVLVLTPFFNEVRGEGDWSPYFVLDAGTDPNWCEGPHGTVSKAQLKSRHISIPMSASCDRTVTDSTGTYHGIAHASGTLEVRR